MSRRSRLRFTGPVINVQVAMVQRRIQKRVEGEAAEKLGKKPAESTAKKRKAGGTAAAKVKKPAVRKRKTKAAERKRLLWGVFNGTLKEEGRFPYDQLDKAEERLEQLRSKSKKLYFIQPIKEVITDSPAAAAEAPASIEEEAVIEPVAGVEADDEESEEPEEQEEEDEE